ncbi:uncharacterized protein [Coffea arabica]|uniref:Uncharacterized protein isoform X2 n=1 Tax=Coffea arabica TaxID=13443 RepID=A0A6P6WN73_COFAR|nr:uncharacterized protein LOC113734002 isoform X2 [Coffea arabica]
MNSSASLQNSLPDDIALKIALSLQVSDVCSLGSCSRFWRELCGSDHVWEALCRDRWPAIDLDEESSADENGNHHLHQQLDLNLMFGFKDVQMFFLRPNINVLFNLIGLHYCFSKLDLPAECVAEALSMCRISERQVCVRWWKLGRWFYGFRLSDESLCRNVTLGDLATSKEEEVLRVLHRGAIHEVLRVQISAAKPECTPW